VARFSWYTTGLAVPAAGYNSGMVNAMPTSATVDRSIPAWVVGLVRRTLLVAGLLFGFFLAGSALAHAEPKLPHPAPVHGIGHGLLRGVPAVSDTITSLTSDPITSVTKVVADVTKTARPVTKVVTALTTDVTTTVVRTTTPILQPAVGMTTPMLQPVLTPVLGPPAGSRPTATAPSATPDVDPIIATPAAQPVSATPAVPTSVVSVLPPQVLPVDMFFAPVVVSSVANLPPARSPHVPLDGGTPIVDVTGGNSTCGSGPTGPMFGISRPFFGLSTTRLPGTGVRPGAGPPKWWFFDPHHHPS
jgi:hypothetical protein